MDIFLIALIVIGAAVVSAIAYFYFQKEESIKLTCECGRDFTVSSLAPDSVKERCPACCLPKRGW